MAFIVFEITLLGDRFLSGGMFPSHCADCELGEPSDNQHHSTQVVSSLEDQAISILSESYVTVDNIRTHLDHPDVPWQMIGDGFQDTLGAARLSLTKATLELPNFTTVITKYFRQCNNKIYGSTIVINKNLQTELHVDSRNEKLPAFLTAITHFEEGEIFLKSAIGDAFVDEYQGFKVPIPIGCTLDVPTFKIPHATCNWQGTRIIAVMFTTPIKRIEACKNNLKCRLQRLGFEIPGHARHWVDTELTGIRFGRPIYSKPTSIRGFMVDAGEHERSAADDSDSVRIVNSDSIEWDLPSNHSVKGNDDSEITHTWPDIFDADISDIECCSEEVAITDIDTSSESTEHLSQKSASAKIEVGGHGIPLSRKRKHHSPARSLIDEVGMHASRHLGFSGSTLGNRFGYTHSSDSKYEDYKSYASQGSSFNLDDCYDRAEFHSEGLFGFNNSRSLIWAISADPIEPFSDDELSHVMTGGAASEATFQPNKADISKLVQKLKMLLISDLKLCKKIERTTDTKQLQSCVAAAAQRMGLANPVDKNSTDGEHRNTSSSNQQKLKIEPTINTGKVHEGKGNLPANQKGKGSADGRRFDQNEHGKGKGKGTNKGPSFTETRNDQNSSKGKAKGKGKQHNITYALDPDGWNVRPLSEFSNSHGGVYLCEKKNKLNALLNKELAEIIPLVLSLLSLWKLGLSSLNQFVLNLSSKVVSIVKKFPCRPSYIKSHMPMLNTAKQRRQ